jgi:hypothetical protein
MAAEVLSEVVNDQFLVSIPAWGGGYAEYRYPTGELTHRAAIALAVRAAIAPAGQAHTGRTVIDVKFARLVGDGCRAYDVTIGFVGGLPLSS